MCALNNYFYNKYCVHNKHSLGVALMCSMCDSNEDPSCWENPPPPQSCAFCNTTSDDVTIPDIGRVTCQDYQMCSITRVFSLNGNYLFVEIKPQKSWKML
jgi:hypothetical protein